MEEHLRRSLRHPDVPSRKKTYTMPLSSESVHSARRKILILWSTQAPVLVTDQLLLSQIAGTLSSQQIPRLDVKASGAADGAAPSRMVIALLKCTMRNPQPSPEGPPGLKLLTQTNANQIVCTG